MDGITFRQVTPLPTLLTYTVSLDFGEDDQRNETLYDFLKPDELESAIRLLVLRNPALVNGRARLVIFPRFD